MIRVCQPQNQRHKPIHVRKENLSWCLLYIEGVNARVFGGMGVTRFRVHQRGGGGRGRQTILGVDALNVSHVPKRLSAHQRSQILSTLTNENKPIKHLSHLCIYL